MDSFKSRKRANVTKRRASVMRKGDGEAAGVSAEKRSRMDISTIETAIHANNSLLMHIRSVQDENEELKELNQQMESRIETLTSENRHLRCKLRIAQPTRMYLTIKRKNELIRHWRRAFYELKCSDKTASKFIEKLDLTLKSHKLKLLQAKQNRQRSHKQVLTKKVHFVQGQPVERQQFVASLEEKDLPLHEDQFGTCLDGDTEADVTQSETDGKTSAPAADEAGLHLQSSGASDSDTPETESQKTKNLTSRRLDGESEGTQNRVDKETNSRSDRFSTVLTSEGTSKSGNPVGVEVVTRDTYHGLHQQVTGKNDESSSRNKDSLTGIGTTQTPSSTDTSSCPSEQSNMIPAVATVELRIKIEKNHDYKIYNPKSIESNWTGREKDSDYSTSSELDPVTEPDMQFVKRENNQVLRHNGGCPTEVSGNIHTSKRTEDGISKNSTVPSENKTDQITVHVSNVITNGSDDNLNFPLVDSANHIKDEVELTEGDFHVIPVGWQDPLLETAETVVSHEPLQSSRKASQDNASVCRHRELRSSCSSKRTFYFTADLLDYQLPSFPSELKQALMEKKSNAFQPGKKLRRVLLDKLFDSVVQKNVWFPSRLGYKKVCSALLRKYCWLPGDIGIWLKALGRKFNSGRKLPNEDTVFKMRKESPGVSRRKKTVSGKNNEKSQQLKVAGKNDETSRSPSNKNSLTGIGTTQTPSSTDTRALPSHRSSRRTYFAADLLDYQLPSFPLELKQALMEKKRNAFMPRKKLKKVLIEKLFESIVQKNVWFPSRLGYKKVCSALLRKYRWLPGDIGVWRNLLKRKFKHARKFLANKDTVLEKHKKFGCPGVSGTKRTVRGKDNEESQQPKDGNDISTEKEEKEDEELIKQHLSILQEEAEKQSMDFQIIYEKMQKTKNFRKQYVFSHTLSETLQTFPVLRVRSYLIEEPFMQHNIMVRGKFEKLLKVLPNLELRAQKKCSSYKVYKQQLKLTMIDTTDVKAQQDLKLLYALRLLPSIFGESEHYIIVDSAQKVKSRNPVIVHEDGFNIMLEGQRLLNAPCQTFTLAAEAWVSSFWTFGLEYPITLRKTFQFLDFAIIERTSFCPVSVTEYVTRLFA